ncbi:MAG: hypothetical protein AB7S38_12805 [Vulcanimicrobiota bacterium]
MLVASSKLVGEGWDCPPLSALFLAMPMGRSPRLEQYIGRLTRPDPDKPEPEVHDYRDHHVEQLEAMFLRRIPIFRRVLGNENLPVEFFSSNRSKRATIRYGPDRARSKQPIVRDSADQLWLFDHE